MSDFPPSAVTLGPPPALCHTHCVLLDFDGTLVEIVDRPDAVVVDAALRSLLRRLSGTFCGRLALVSGRSIAQLDAFLGSTLGEIAIVGSHGAEVRVGGHTISPLRPSALRQAERSLRAGLADYEGVIIESKSQGVAVHYRLAAAAEGPAHYLACKIAAESGLAVQEGKMMVELRAPGHDKGTGIATLLTHNPFAGAVPVFVGDDLTDEAGFEAVATRGGMGVLVGPARQTSARYRLPDVASVRAWLDKAA